MIINPDFFDITENAPTDTGYQKSDQFLLKTFTYIKEDHWVNLKNQSLFPVVIDMNSNGLCVNYLKFVLLHKFMQQLKRKDLKVFNYLKFYLFWQFVDIALQEKYECSFRY